MIALENPHKGQQQLDASICKKLFRAPAANRGRAVLEVAHSIFHPDVNAGDLISVDFTKNRLCGDGLYIVAFRDMTEWFGIRRFQRLPGQWWISANNPRKPFEMLTAEMLDRMQVIGYIIDVYKANRGGQPS